MDIAKEFGLDVSSTGRIINHMCTTITAKYEHVLSLWPGLTQSRIARYAAAITQLEPAIIDIWAFIDGTGRDIARPVVDQRASYSGYTRTHMQKYHGVLAPDGLIVSLIGPFVGSKNDLNMLEESGLEGRLSPIVRQNGRVFMMFGDLFYHDQDLVMCAYSEATTDPIEKAYNDVMKKVRVYIETGFGKVTSLFSGTDLKRVNRTGLSPTAAYVLYEQRTVHKYSHMHAWQQCALEHCTAFCGRISCITTIAFSCASYTGIT